MCVVGAAGGSPTLAFPTSKSAHATRTCCEPAQDRETVTFRVKPTTKFAKIMKAWCEKQQVEQSSVRFMFDGERISGDNTPLDLDMEDGDQVDVTTLAVGGMQ